MCNFISKSICLKPTSSFYNIGLAVAKSFSSFSLHTIRPLHSTTHLITNTIDKNVPPFTINSLHSNWPFQRPTIRYFSTRKYEFPHCIPMYKIKLRGLKRRPTYKITIPVYKKYKTLIRGKARKLYMHKTNKNSFRRFKFPIKDPDLTTNINQLLLPVDNTPAVHITKTYWDEEGPLQLQERINAFRSCKSLVDFSTNDDQKLDKNIRDLEKLANAKNAPSKIAFGGKMKTVDYQNQILSTLSTLDNDVKRCFQEYKSVHSSSMNAASKRNPKSIKRKNIKRDHFNKTVDILEPERYKSGGILKHPKDYDPLKDGMVMADGGKGSCGSVAKTSGSCGKTCDTDCGEPAPWKKHVEDDPDASNDPRNDTPWARRESGKTGPSSACCDPCKKPSCPEPKKDPCACSAGAPASGGCNECKKDPCTCSAGAPASGGCNECKKDPCSCKTAAEPPKSCSSSCLPRPKPVPCGKVCKSTYIPPWQIRCNCPPAACEKDKVALPEAVVSEIPCQQERLALPKTVVDEIASIIKEVSGTSCPKLKQKLAMNQVVKAQAIQEKPKKRPLQMEKSQQAVICSQTRLCGAVSTRDTWKPVEINVVKMEGKKCKAEVKKNTSKSPEKINDIKRNFGTNNFISNFITRFFQSLNPFKSDLEPAPKPFVPDLPPERFIKIEEDELFHPNLDWTKPERRYLMINQVCKLDEPTNLMNRIPDSKKKTWPWKLYYSEKNVAECNHKVTKSQSVMNKFLNMIESPNNKTLDKESIKSSLKEIFFRNFEPAVVLAPTPIADLFMEKYTFDRNVYESREEKWNFLFSSHKKGTGFEYGNCCRRDLEEEEDPKKTPEFPSSLDSKCKNRPDADPCSCEEKDISMHKMCGNCPAAKDCTEMEECKTDDNEGQLAIIDDPSCPDCALIKVMEEAYQMERAPKLKFREQLPQGKMKKFEKVKFKEEKMYERSATDLFQKKKEKILVNELQPYSPLGTFKPRIKIVKKKVKCEPKKLGYREILKRIEEKKKKMEDGRKYAKKRETNDTGHDSD